MNDHPVRRLTRAGLASAWVLGGTVVVALTAVVVAHPGPLPGEIGWVLALQRLSTPVPEVAEFVRLTTGTEGAVVVGIVPAVLAVWAAGRRGLLAVLVVAAAMLIVQPVMKELVDRPRPDETHVEVRAAHTSMSFPSGHSLSTTALWGTFVGLAARRRRAGLAIVASIPIAANLFASGVQGVHWPSDAIAGTLIGAAAAAVAVELLEIERSG